MFLAWLSYYSHWFVIVVFSSALSFFVMINNLSSSLIRNEINEKFHYVIVGGGSAGAVLALRLSENKHVSVLLIEAGIITPDILKIPVLGPLKQTSDLDWQYRTISQKHSCFGLNNNSSIWPAGKILGGSTHLNYMTYLKGHDNDFLSWKHPHSNEWCKNDINTYFKKAMECTENDLNRQFFCNKKGSLFVREAPFTTNFSEAVLNAAVEIGYNVTDLNLNGRAGFMRPQVNINTDGRRWTSDQKLKDALHYRKNLKVISNSVVERVMLMNGYEAHGVEYRVGSSGIQTVFASEEIILSAGTIGSAKILMLSGIGLPKDLSKAKIETKIDLPVGKNLQDHITTGLDLILLNQSIFSVNHLTDPRSAYNYFIHGKGPYTSALIEAVGVVHSDLVNSVKDSPDLEFMAMMAGVTSDGGLFSRHAFGISDKLWDDYFALITPGFAFSILPVLLHPKSTGEVKLNPDDPRGSPQINPRYLSDEADIATLIQGIRIVEKLLNTTAMRDLGAKLNELKLPVCENFLFDSDDYWKCYIQHLTFTSYHPVGTCKMGSRNSVVDHRLRVYKTNKLRVVDASIMPTMPSANINAAVVMIAEKGADLIKEDYHNRRSFCYAKEVLLPTRNCESP